MMSNRKKYQQIFEEVFHVDNRELSEHFTFKDVDAWDSFAHLTLISELEDAFGIMFESDDILHFGGYVNGMEILKRYGIDFDE